MAQQLDLAVVAAHRLFDAFEQGDRVGMLNVLTEDAVVWHNHDDREKLLSEQLDTLLATQNVAERFEYVDRRYQPIDGGALLQHRLSGSVPGGATFDAPILIRMTMRGDRIARMEEYVDRGTLASLYAAMRK